MSEQKGNPLVTVIKKTVGLPVGSTSSCCSGGCCSTAPASNGQTGDESCCGGQGSVKTSESCCG